MPKKTKTVKSDGRVMTIVVWDVNGIIFMGYLEIGQSTAGVYYASLMDKLSGRKCPYLTKN